MSVIQVEATWHEEWISPSTNIPKYWVVEHPQTIFFIAQNYVYWRSKPDIDFHYFVIPWSSFSEEKESISEAYPKFPIFVHVVHFSAYFSWSAPAKTGVDIFSSKSSSLLLPGAFVFWKCTKSIQICYLIATVCVLSLIPNHKCFPPGQRREDERGRGTKGGREGKRVCMWDF